MPHQRHHDRVKDAFFDASRLAGAARSRSLDETCGDDHTLRSEVESLLRHHDNDPQVLNKPPAAVAATIEVADLTVGQLVAGRYRVEARLGAGGMATVYRVRDALLDTDVALKLLRFAGVAHRERLFEEVRLARRISHPTVCRVYDAGEHDGGYFLTMELVEGEDLASVLERDGPLASGRVVELGCELLDGLAAAHAAGVVHCDLKPSNLLLDRGGRLRLTDFGIGASLRGAASPGFTGGSPAYLAPEILGGGLPTERTDLFGVGLVLYELLTGHRAFDGDTAEALFAAIREGELVAPSRRASGVDPGLEAVVIAALSRSPDSRPASALAMRGQLSSGEPSGATTAENAVDPGNLPASVTSFVGREAEMRRLGELLFERRLVTVAGPGGVGKTRLAIELARAQRRVFPDGVHLADVSSVAAESLAGEVARVLGESAGSVSSLARRLRARRGRRQLLVLDCCDRVAEAAGTLAERLLAANPFLRIVATSRRPLHADGEQVVRLAPLDVPQTTAAASVDPLSFDGPRLFVERARLADPEFDVESVAPSDLVELCQRLDGLPLAIELAAARVTAFSVRDLVALKEARGQVLRSSRAEVRHRSLGALLDWSFSQLSADQRRLLRRLAVLAGWFQLDAAAALVGGKAERLAADLAELIDLSLVVAGEATEPRTYRLLDTVRGFGRERLREAGDELEAEDAMIDHYRRLVGAIEPGKGDYQIAWRRLELEWDNLVACIELCAKRPEHHDAVGELAAALHLFLWPHPARRSWAMTKLRAVLEGETLGRDARTQAQYALALMLAKDGDPAAARQALEEVLATAEAADDPDWAVRAGVRLAENARGRGDLDAALSHLKRALETSERSSFHLRDRQIQSELAVTRMFRGEHEQARRGFVIAERLEPLVGSASRASLYLNRGANEILAGEYDLALGLLEQGLEIATRLGADNLILRGGINIACVHAERGELGDVWSRYEELLDKARDGGNIDYQAMILAGLADAGVRRDDAPRARAYCIEGLELMGRVTVERVSAIRLLEGAAWILMADGRAAVAARIAAAAAHFRAGTGTIAGDDGERHAELVAMARGATGAQAYAEMEAVMRGRSVDEIRMLALTALRKG